jgi:GDPmannose 4,6-dehydratase
MKKKILIAGIYGQDGSYLAQYLIKKKNYQIIGLTRKIRKNFKYFAGDEKKIKIIQTNYNYSSLSKIVKKIKPFIIFNLTGQSVPVISWSIPDKTIFSIVNININFIKTILNFSKKTRYFNASTSDIFSQNTKIIDEQSPISPDNPYGCAKACSHFLIKSYRQRYKLFLVNGILFNHDSTRRSINFIGKKIINNAIKIKLGIKKKIFIQDASVIRDFGYAKDYVEGIYKIMKLSKPEDFIIATGKSISVKEYVEKTFKILGLDKKLIVDKKIKSYVKNKIRSKNKKISNKTNWKPTSNLKKMISIMLKEELIWNFKNAKFKI